MPDDLQNAALLKRAKLQTVHRSNFPKEVREKRIREKMNHYKAKLTEAVNAKNKEDIGMYLKKLVKVRAELFVLQTEDEFGGMTDDKEKLNIALKKYYQDCFRLQTSFSVFLN